MAFPSLPANKDIHIENGITFRYLTARNRWELWNDSDATESSLDSEYHARREADSDLRFDLDSEIHARKAADSDIYAYFEIDLDSERHDWKAADSDITFDLDSEIHARKAADSDIHDLLDSEYRHRKDVDSDLRYALDSEIHDRKAADSDFDDVYSLQISRQRIPIDTTADFVRVDTAWEFLETVNNTSGWYTHNDGAGTQRSYVIINGRLITQFVGLAAEVTVNNRTYRRAGTHFAQRVFERNGVGQTIQALIYDFDVERLDRLDYDFIVDSETNRAGLDSDIKNNFVEMIRGFRQLDSEVQILQRFDSDLNLRFSDLDSENKRMHDSDIHDRKASDSDLRYALDSEIHDRKAADSDIYAYFEIDLDSERHDWKAGDSDIRNRKAESAYMVEDTVFIPATQLSGGSLQFLTDGTNISQVNILSPVGSGWFTIANTIFTGLLNDTNVIIDNDEVVGILSDPGFVTTQYTLGRKTYSNLGQPTPLVNVAVSGPGNPNTNSAPAQLGISYDDQLEYTNRKELKTPEDFDSDTTRNFDVIANALSRLDSEIKFVYEDLDRNFVAYDSDSEIEAAAVRFTNDPNVGRLYWDDSNKTLSTSLNSDVTLQIGQEFHFFAKADSDIANGDVVMFSGAEGDHLKMRKANHRVPGFIPEWIMGVATADVTRNQFGYVTQIGTVRGLNTSAFTEGALLYSDPFVDSRLLDSEPPYPSHSILMAAVTRSHATEGSIYVRITHKPDLDELHGVLVTDPTEGQKHNQIIAWDSDTTLWRNISLDADFGDF